MHLSRVLLKLKTTTHITPAANLQAANHQRALLLLAKLVAKRLAANLPAVQYRRAAFLARHRRQQFHQISAAPRLQALVR